MAELDLDVALVVARYTPSSPWGEPIWMAAQALEGRPAAAPWSLLAETSERRSYFAGVYPVRLHSSSTGYYRDNLETGAPKLWVVMRPQSPEPPLDIVLVTADPTEGEGATETGTYLVSTIDLPPVLVAEVAAFIAEHHVERVFEKRQRDKSKPHMDDRGLRRPAGK